MPEFCDCGSIKTFGVCTNRHCQVLNNKNAKWIINGEEVRFKKQLTFEEAIQAVKDKSLLVSPSRKSFCLKG